MVSNQLPPEKFRRCASRLGNQCQSVGFFRHSVKLPNSLPLLEELLRISRFKVLFSLVFLGTSYLFICFVFIFPIPLRLSKSSTNSHSELNRERA